jgi:hypothetical protein
MEEEGVGHAREGREDLSGLSDEGFRMQYVSASTPSICAERSLALAFSPVESVVFRSAVRMGMRPEAKRIMLAARMKRLRIDLLGQVSAIRTMLKTKTTSDIRLWSSTPVSGSDQRSDHGIHQRKLSAYHPFVEIGFSLKCYL